MAHAYPHSQDGPVMTPEALEEALRLMWSLPPDASRACARGMVHAATSASPFSLTKDTETLWLSHLDADHRRGRAFNHNARLIANANHDITVFDLLR